MRSLSCVPFALALVSGCSTTDPPPVATESAPLGRYAFVLEESDVFAKIQAGCQREKEPKVCLAGIADEAGREGIRLSLDADGHLVWTSYGLAPDGKTETVFLEATLAAHWDETKVNGTVVGALRGRDAQGSDFVGLSLVRVDDRTVAMIDPRKGRLVFRKSP